MYVSIQSGEGDKGHEALGSLIIIVSHMLTLALFFSPQALVLAGIYKINKIITVTSINKIIIAAK